MCPSVTYRQWVTINLKKDMKLKGECVEGNIEHIWNGTVYTWSSFTSYMLEILKNKKLSCIYLVLIYISLMNKNADYLKNILLVTCAAFFVN